MNIVSFLIFLVISFWSPLFHTQVRGANGSLINPVVKHERNRTISIGAIFDETSRPGKEAKVAIEMAIDDFSLITNQYLFLYSRNSQGKPGRAAVAAKELISTHGVKLILGAHTGDEASAIAEVASEEAHDDVPVFLSFADLTPNLPKFPCVLQAAPNEDVQMNAVAAIIQSWGLLQVTLMYENVPTLSSPDLVVSQLSQALQQSGGELSHIFTLTSFSLGSLQKELILLKEKNCRVFVIHSTLESGYRLYQNAKKLNMTGDGYVWIATNSITDLFHSVSPKNMSLMQGIIGTKTYFHENSQDFQSFRKRFQSHFKSIYPDEESDEPGIFASQAYNAIQRISAAGFSGSRGEFQCVNWKIAPAKVVEIVNVVGKSYQSGYWTEGFGFSETLDDEALHHTSMEALKEVLWLAQPWHTERRRRILAGGSEPIRVGVPGHSIFRQFVKVDTDPRTNKTSYEGFSIKVFEEVMKIANKDLKYEYIPFKGTYNDMVEQISLGNFTAVAGDVTILEERQKYADFSQPYTESGMVLIVPIRPRLPSRIWLFMKPFTTKMWCLIVVITLYNGFTVWLIERNHNDEFRSGPVWNQIGTLYWLAFSTLFTLRGDRLHSNLSRMAMVVWLFVALIITQSYTASLASMLTAQRLEPAIKDVATLKKMNATVGYCKGSFLGSYLIGTLGFPPEKIIKYPSTAEYAKALNNKTIAGIFLEVPPAKVFLAQYCKSFIKTEKTFKVGGFGFAFEKGFPLLPAINNAIMNITESEKLLALEQEYINSEECVDASTIPDEETSIGLNSFSILFMLTGCTSTFALAVFVIRHFLNSESELRKVFKAFIKKWRRYRRQTSARVINVESPRIPSDATYSEARQSFSTTSDVESVVDHQDVPHLR